MKYARSESEAVSPGSSRDRKRGIPCSSMILTSRTCGKPAARAASLASAAALRCGAFVRIPRSRLAQQQIRELQAALGLLRERLRHVAELALGRGNGLVVRTPDDRRRRSRRTRRCASTPRMTIQNRRRAARVASASSEPEADACDIGGRTRVSHACRADHALDRREQVAPREWLGDHLSNAKRFGGGARSDESRPELPRYRDQRRLRVRGLDGAQPSSRLRGAACTRRRSRDPPDPATCASPGAAARTEYPSALSHSTRSSRMSLSSSMMTILDMAGSGTRPFVADDFGVSHYIAPALRRRFQSMRSHYRCSGTRPEARGWRQVARWTLRPRMIGPSAPALANRHDPSVQDFDRRVEDVACSAFGLDVFGLPTAFASILRRSRRIWTSIERS